MDVNDTNTPDMIVVRESDGWAVDVIFLPSPDFYDMFA
jgi:hypothetical protein